MTNPILYDARRTLTSKSVLIIMAVLILISLALIPSFILGSDSTSQFQGNSLVVQFFGGVLGLFIPLIAILGSYNSYGKDRVSGVLESVLAQPVSRRGLALSRYLSSFLAMAIATSISLGVVDVIARYYTGSFVDTTIMLSSAGAFLVELAAFIGIMMLFAHLTRSSGALIGIGIGLFMIMDFFWGLIVDLLASNAGGSFSAGFIRVMIIGQFVNPAQFVSVVDTYLTQQVSSVGMVGNFGPPFAPSQYGVTVPSIVVAGIIWVALPLAAFMHRATKKD
jgi:ABC-2 type transport system permease protein